MPSVYELQVADAISDELTSDADLLAEFGKSVDRVYLVDSSPNTKVVVQIHEVSQSVGDVHWAKSYAIYDGSWDTADPPRPEVIAAQVSTEIMESSFAAGI